MLIKTLEKLKYCYAEQKKKKVFLKHHLFRYYWTETLGADFSQIQIDQKKKKKVKQHSP